MSSIVDAFLILTQAADHGGLAMHCGTLEFQHTGRLVTLLLKLNLHRIIDSGRTFVTVRQSL
jgi:hypothetical protein